MSTDTKQAKIDQAREETEQLIAQIRAEREKREANEAVKGQEKVGKKDQGPKPPGSNKDKGKKDQSKGSKKPIVTPTRKRVEEEEDENMHHEEAEEEALPKKKARKMIEISDDDDDVDEKGFEDKSMMKHVMIELRNLRKQIQSSGSQKQDQLVLPSSYNCKITERNVQQIHGIRRRLRGSFLFHMTFNCCVN